MREIMNQYGRTLVASVIMVLLFTVFAALSVNRETGRRGVTEISGGAVAEAVKEQDVAVDQGLVETKLRSKADGTCTRDLRRNRQYEVTELLQSDHGGSVRLLSVQRDGADAVENGLAEFDGSSVVFHQHGIYALRYTVTAKNGAERTGYLYGEVLR